MAFVGGDLLEISASHPEFGDRTFYPKAAESFTLNKGGVRTNDDANSVTSNGTIIQQKNNTLENLIKVYLMTVQFLLYLFSL